MPELSILQQLFMIDNFIEISSYVDPKWVQLLLQYRVILVEMQKEATDERH